MTNLAVIFASPPNWNLGMQVVDVAWEALRADLGPQVQVDKYRFDAISAAGGTSSGYRCLTRHAPELNEADAILYWGDFLQMASYQEAVAQKLASRGAVDGLAEARRLVRTCLLGEGLQSRVRQKVLVFGSTQLLDSPRRIAGEPYRSQLTRMAQDALLWCPRDIYSSGLVSSLSGRPNVSQGVDCAMLAWPPPQVRAFSHSSARPNIGVFFHRSPISPNKLLTFAKDLAAEVGGSTSWIPWISPGGILKRRERLTKFFAHRHLDEVTVKKWQVADVLQSLSTYSLVVTDTYHLAVNAWSAGVPAVCIGDLRSSDIQSVNSGARFAWRDKRYMHYQMYDALDFFVHTDELSATRARKARIRHIAGVVDDSKVLSLIADRMGWAATNARRTIGGALEGL